MDALGGGLFLMSEVPLYIGEEGGTLSISKAPPTERATTEFSARF